MSVFAVQAAYAQINLTGIWFCNDGGTYYITQGSDKVGNNIVRWYGESSPTSPLFANVATGTFDGVVALTLDWTDVPKGGTTGNGILIIEVLDVNDMALVYGTGGFAGTYWTRFILE